MDTEQDVGHEPEAERPTWWISPDASAEEEFAVRRRRVRELAIPEGRKPRGTRTAVPRGVRPRTQGHAPRQKPRRARRTTCPTRGSPSSDDGPKPHAVGLRLPRGGLSATELVDRLRLDRNASVRGFVAWAESRGRGEELRLLEPLVAAGLVERRGDSFRLTPEGMAVRDMLRGTQAALVEAAA